MLEPSRLPLFLLASLVLLLTPGPAVMYIITRSIDQGRPAGLVSVLSIETGNFCHVLAATFGLSALLMSSALAFSVVKYLGAAYLVYLGLRKLFRRAQPAVQETVPAPQQSYRQIFSQGVVVAVLNPKTALFFLAFLPQFVERSAGAVPLQMLTLGCIFVLMAIVSDGMYALLAGSLGQWLKGSALWRAEGYVSGGVYVLLGLAAAFSDAGMN
jgi:threonine/homoserine/homoserine lactone efflux protein